MVIALIAGIGCGIGQFFLLRRALRPIAQGKNPSAMLLLSQLPIPSVLLLSCAMIDVVLLPFAGGGFCGGLIVSAVVNLLIEKKKKD